MEGKAEAEALSVRGFLHFSAAEPGATSSLGITWHLCQTGRAQERTPPTPRAKVPHCDLLQLPGWAPAEGSCRYLQNRLREK